MSGVIPVWCYMNRCKWDLLGTNAFTFGGPAGRCSCYVRCSEEMDSHLPHTSEWACQGDHTLGLEAITCCRVRLLLCV